MPRSWELQREVVDRRGVTVLGRRLDVPLSGRTLRHVDVDGRRVVTLAMVSRSTRKGEHVVTVSDGDAWTLQQRKWTQFVLHDPSGAPRARFGEKLRPTRGMRQSWDLEVDGAPVVSLRNRAAINPWTKLRQELGGRQLATFSTKDDEVHLHLWQARGLLEADPVPPALADAVVGAVLLAVVHDLYDHDNI